MPKVLIITFVAIAACAYASDASQLTVAERSKARVSQAFPYEPGHMDSETTSLDTLKETSPAVVLSTVVVQAPKLLVLRPEEVLSRTELSTLIRKKYPGASLKGQDPLHYEGGLPNYGALLYSDDKRMLLLRDLSDFSRALHDSGDAVGSVKLRKLIQEASVRRPDALREAMDKSANNGRR